MPIITTDSKHYADIAQAIRETGDTSETFLPSEMPAGVREAVENAYSKGEASGYDSGFEEGKVVGSEEGYAAGQQAEYDRFWDTFQRNGNKVTYAFAFSGFGWTDETYNPKYPINATDNSNGLFYYAYYITDTKVPINLGTTSMNKANMFYYASSLVTIQKLICNSEAIGFTEQFTGCTKLKNITFEGVIGRSFNAKWCPLTVESMKSIISCLKNYAGTEEANTYTLTFTDACWSALEADSTAPDGGTWKDYVTNTLCWNV